MQQKIDIPSVVEYIQRQTPESRIYIGADSEVFQRNGIWMGSFATAVCIHRIEDGIGRGCKVFGEITEERIYDKDRRKPSMRLMNEAYKLAEMYQRLEPYLQGREVELHIDINRDKQFASNAVLDQAIGYLRGVTGINALPKPDSPAASFASDRLAYLLTPGI